MKKSILSCRNISFFHGEKKIIRSLSCEVTYGDRISLIGPSGSGKTSFLRLCAGLEKPSSGEILLRGETVASSSIFVPPGKRHIGFVFQNFALFDKVNIQKNIYYGCQNSEHEQEAIRLIELFKLQDHLKKYPHQLSGGEKQKVALARSLAVKTDLIFLDEPFSSIDSGQTKFLIEEMKELFSILKITALMVTHSPEEAELFSDRIIDFEKINS